MVNGQQHFHLEATRTYQMYPLQIVSFPHDMTHITDHVGQYQVKKKKIIVKIHFKQLTEADRSVSDLLVFTVHDLFV